MPKAKAPKPDIADHPILPSDSTDQKVFILATRIVQLESVVSQFVQSTGKQLDKIHRKQADSYDVPLPIYLARDILSMYVTRQDAHIADNGITAHVPSQRELMPAEEIMLSAACALFETFFKAGRVELGYQPDAPG